MCLPVSYKKKIGKESDPELDPDLFVRGMDPLIRIRTKMSRISNTDQQSPK